MEDLQPTVMVKTTNKNVKFFFLSKDTIKICKDGEDPGKGSWYLGFKLLKATDNRQTTK